MLFFTRCLFTQRSFTPPGLSLIHIFVVLAGQDGVERDTHDGGGGQAREADGAYLHSARAGVGDADGQHQDCLLYTSRCV